MNKRAIVYLFGIVMLYLIQQFFFKVTDITQALIAYSTMTILFAIEDKE